jgi:hypothetical protein
MGLIESKEEVVMTMRFRVPPGVLPEQARQQIALYGVTVAVGLLPYLKETTCVVSDPFQV